MKLRNLLRSKGIDNREFIQGQVYIATDTDVKIPDDIFGKRTLHENGRPVVIIYDVPDNKNPLVRTVLAAPLSSKIEYKRETDLYLDEADGVERPSLLRLGLTQPFLKVDLQGPVRTLTEDAIDKMLALQLHLMGVSLEETEDIEQDDCSTDDYEVTDLPF